VGETRRADGDPDDCFVVDTSLPTGTALQGRQFSLTFGTYHVVGGSAVQNGISEMFEIDHVEQIGCQTFVCVTHDHQLVMADGVTIEQMAPQRTFEFANQSFEIALSTSAVP